MRGGNSEDAGLCGRRGGVGGGVVWEGDTRRLELLMVFCNFLTLVHRRNTITVFNKEGVNALLDHG